MRLFAALDLDAATRDAVAERQSALRAALDADLRWVQPAQLHMTLVFLGHVDDARVLSLAGSFSEPLGQRAFDIVLAGLGAFPARGAPRALWVGIREGDAAVLALHREVVIRFRLAGIDAGSSAFHPHLTLARYRRSRAGDRHAAVGYPAFERGLRQKIEHVTLYKSELSSGPPRYVELARANLISI